MTAPDTRAKVEQLLAEHRYEGTASSVVCSCGWSWRQSFPGMHDLGFAAASAAHIAAVLADAGLLADTRPAEPAQGEGEWEDDLFAALLDEFQDEDEAIRARDAVRHLIAQPTAPQPHADTVETVEWGVEFPSGAVEVMTEADARRYGLNANGLRPDLPTLVVRRVVGPWEVVS